VVTYNVLATAKAALAKVHGADTIGGSSPTITWPPNWTL
jgi:hypothetical protein